MVKNLHLKLSTLIDGRLGHANSKGAHGQDLASDLQGLVVSRIFSDSMVQNAYLERAIKLMSTSPRTSIPPPSTTWSSQRPISNIPISLAAAEFKILEE